MVAIRFKRVAVVISALSVAVLLFLGLPSRWHPGTPASFSLCTREVPEVFDRLFEWTIFITPQGFVGAAAHQQRRAILSWLRLKPRPRIVLVGRGEGYETVAAELGLELDARLDLNFAMLPLAGSLVHLASNYPTEIACIINSDIILTQSFVDAIAKTRNTVTTSILNLSCADVAV